MKRKIKPRYLVLAMITASSLTGTAAMADRHPTRSGDAMSRVQTASLGFHGLGALRSGMAAANDRHDGRGHQGDVRGHMGDTRGHRGDTRGHTGDHPSSPG
ncbi:hypothetical protein [Hephaestia mangrovi]|uniref:hypothetical protein n=1 Tax=Hephaestia mangrovi TaxID=2873268 RepID=UPI001CA78387|nr:hypothetical protein [Hephaestia mangrovi]MBY8827215.1 hypothetical protein [Hephaestia mangrovi]